VESD
jgi:hypothetical protein